MTPPRRTIFPGGRTAARVAPSVLAADFSRLAAETAEVEAAGADLLHLDVMDGHFVPNLTFGPPVVAAIRKATRLPLDVHLMIERPERWAQAFLDAGSDLVSFHVEAASDPAGLARQIRAAGAEAGLAVSPGTPVERALPHLADFDLLLVMTVHPGFGGQKFMPKMLDKVRRARAAAGPDYPIEVDGGIDRTNIRACREAGATLFVAGTSVFGQPDRAFHFRALVQEVSPSGPREVR